MSDDIQAAREQIALTRAALAETTAALAVKADVKTRATAAIKQNQAVVAAAAGALLLLVALRFRTAHHRSRGRSRG